MAFICMFLDVMYWRIPWEINVEFTTPSVLKVYPRDYMKASLSENCYLLVLLFLMFKVQIQIQKRWDKIINVEHFTLHFSYWVKYEILPWQLSIFKLRYHFDFLIFRFVRFLFVFVVLFVFESRPVQIFLRCFHICSFICI